jgi:DNA (cytosine-5)-methyltransferase 1
VSSPHSWTLADLDKVQKNGIKVFSTFSCGGGSSMGYKLAGCDVIGANDIDPEMQWHYETNLAPRLYYLCPVRDLVTKDLPDELFDLDILDGSPPCTTFSMAGNREENWGVRKHFREGQAEQVLSDLFFDFLDVAERLKPKAIIAENVRGLIAGNAKGYTRMIHSRLIEIGYRPQIFLLNAADCGVPQSRERVFFCALRNDIERGKLVINPQIKRVSVAEATSDLTLSDLEREQTSPAPFDLKYWPHTPRGSSYKVPRIRETGKQSLFQHYRLSGQLQSPTLTTRPDTHKHWDECRTLSLREWVRLGSFPDDYTFQRDRLGKYVIGMSVPPLMTKQVAQAVCQQWLQ